MYFVWLSSGGVLAEVTKPAFLGSMIFNLAYSICRSHGEPRRGAAALRTFVVIARRQCFISGRLDCATFHDFRDLCALLSTALCFGGMSFANLVAIGDFCAKWSAARASWTLGVLSFQFSMMSAVSANT